MCGDPLGPDSYTFCGLHMMAFVGPPTGYGEVER